MKIKIQLLTIMVIFAGCATRNNEKLDQKMSEESSISSRSDLQAQAENSIKDASNLTTEQKEKLTALRYSVSAQTDEFNRQSIELRSVLLKDLLASDYNAKEVRLIKSRMRKLENQKLSLIFEAADKANVILERQAAENHLIMREFIGERNRR